ncbi:hypothetical protein [Streptomyces sp. NBC_01363]|uniref:hypothetical protein n=1 Tax=Streptomyces sp. NBC_01363 TaxID=2903840 RepID=UPI0022529F27|nr:hypothetical protein [Streptomyces sp. NBC_01363]MCX4736958.1 hypothetical protein [Streptomyces sp. NBC_01363]
MSDTRAVAGPHPPVPDATHEPQPSGPVVTTEPDPTPIVRAVATRVRVALRGDSGRQALQRLPGPDPIALCSVSDAQRATLTRTSQGLHVGTLGPGVPVAMLDVDPSSLTVSSASGDDLAVETVSALLNPDPPALDAAAEDFWALSSPVPGMPGLVLSAVDTGEVVRVGPQEEPYEIHGSDIDLRRLAVGFDWLLPSVRAGRFAIKGTHRQLSVVIGASMKAVYDV